MINKATDVSFSRPLLALFDYRTQPLGEGEQYKAKNLIGN
jgi:hypothetical protein